MSPGVFGNTAWKAFLIQTSMNSQAQEDFSVINAKLANVTVKTIKNKMFQFFVWEKRKTFKNQKFISALAEKERMSVKAKLKSILP